MDSKYTHIYNAQIENLLDSLVREIAFKIASYEYASDISAVVLGGGYGRGEGGIIFEANCAPKLSNDLDFFVFIKHAKNRADIAGFLGKLSKEYKKKLFIDVDFDAPKLLEETARIQNSMMFQEMLQGHKIVFGRGDILNSISRMDFSKMPIFDAARLAMNRGTGLALASIRLENPKDQADIEFIARNVNKAKLACMDIELILRGKYTLLNLDKLEALKSLNLGEEFFKECKVAVDFKYAPDYFLDAKLLKSRWTQAQEMWQESVKKIPACEFSLYACLKNIYLNLKMFFDFKAAGASLCPIKSPTIKLLKVLIANRCKIKNEEYFKIWKRIS